MPNDPRTEFPVLTKDGEAAWTEFRYYVEWTEDFALIFLFSSYPAATALFFKRLEETGVSSLQRISTDHADGLAKKVLATLKGPSNKFAALAAPIWIDAAKSTDPEWLKACDIMLARLNEHRDMLRDRIKRPLIISLPGGYRQRAREIAPDLWAIRHYSLDLDDVNPVENDEPSQTDSPNDIEPAQPAFIGNAQSLLDEWRRLTSHAAASREAITAGWRAVSAALSLGKFEEAGGIALEIMVLARQAADADPNEAVLRDLSLSLDKVGETALRLGKLKEAEAAYRESLAIWRRLAQAFPDDAEYAEMARTTEMKLQKMGAA